jgi:hypothetical protein
MRLKEGTGSFLRSWFRVAKVTRPKHAEDLDAFDAEFVVPILRAIQAKDWPAFKDAFRKGVEGSDRYHDKTGYQYIRYVLPEDPPSGLHLGPPESLRRETEGQS